MNIITPPTDNLVTLAQLKEHLVIDFSDDDTRLNLLLETTRDFLENQTNQCLDSQMWEEKFPHFYSVTKLKKNPLQSLVVTYYDSDNALQTLDTNDYLITKTTHQSEVEAITIYPNTYARKDAVIFTYGCGYSSVPAVMQQACLLLAASWNESLSMSSAAINRSFIIVIPGGC